MKREDIEKLLGEGADKEAVTALLNTMHEEITSYKDAAKEAQDSLAEKVKEIGVLSKSQGDVDALKQSIADWETKYNTDLEASSKKLSEIEFDSKLKEIAAKYQCKNLKAAKALLDLESIQGSKNQDVDIDKAFKTLVEKEAYLFGETPAKPTGEKQDVGGKIDSTKGNDKKDEPATLREAVAEHYKK